MPGMHETGMTQGMGGSWTEGGGGVRTAAEGGERVGGSRSWRARIERLRRDAGRGWVVVKGVGGGWCKGGWVWGVDVRRVVVKDV